MPENTLNLSLFIANSSDPKGYRVAAGKQNSDETIPEFDKSGFNQHLKAKYPNTLRNFKAQKNICILLVG
jgi:hypothetical protein